MAILSNQSIISSDPPLSHTLQIYFPMHTIADRRKMKSSLLLPEDDCFLRMSTNTRSFTITAPPSLDEMRKIVKGLEDALKDERQLREELEENLLIYKTRVLSRERQFYSILEKTHKEVKKYNEKAQESDGGHQVVKIFAEIFEKFEQSNEATNIFIQNRYKDNMGMMERRIHEILSVVDEEITKNKRVSGGNYKEIKKEIELAMGLALGVEEENRRLKKKLDETLFKNQILNEEKNLLIEELVQKKKVILKLYNQVKGNTIRNRKNTQESSKQASKEARLSIPDAREQSTTNVFKFVCEPSIDVSDFNPNRSMSINCSLSQKEKSYANRSQATKMTRTILKSPMQNGLSQQLTTSNEKTIQHLRLCLDREKKKVAELGKIVTQIQNRNNEINTAIAEAMAESKNSGNPNCLQHLVKSEKLFQAIRDLKKRLSMYEKPSTHCGWSEEELEELMKRE